jgi:DHA2 family multidrug resistance protein
MLARGGMDATTARATAHAMIDFAVSRQATVLSFEKMFLLAGILFLLVMPMLLFLRAPDEPRSGEKIEVHVEL